MSGGSGATRWWLLRHAPVPCPFGRIHGRLDVACDTSEDDAFRALTKIIPSNPVLVESGLIRCRQTAGALETAGMLLPPPIIEPDLMEQDFGRWQGRSWSDLEAVKDPDLASFWRDPAGTAPPGGESFAAMIQRVSAALQSLSSAQSGRDILAIVHAGTIRAALAQALDLEPATALRFAVHPLSLTRLDFTAEGWRIEMVNALSH
ncbi:histidine phosphatase family protein [Paramagnetospirillum kuznetsovii]|uniref:Histidine phosphatase family protein n=1 Tax=Paramagnetospirillum kuznetsovii TaxID=2053833 RepID=A0A364P1G6_9PROT|nr:histidine phosphatase family protein [Paramagnetospirillum kuznetsovii]RAU23007.1 histidine phosphatase family protein [Paramagnetospirillum kuznetsovii]